MIKVFKSELDKVSLCEQIEKNSWIDLVNPTEEEVQKISTICEVKSSIIMQVLVRSARL